MDRGDLPGPFHPSTSSQTSILNPRTYKKGGRGGGPIVNNHQLKNHIIADCDCQEQESIIRNVANMANAQIDLVQMNL